MKDSREPTDEYYEEAIKRIKSWMASGGPDYIAIHMELKTFWDLGFGAGYEAGYTREKTRHPNGDTTRKHYLLENPCMEIKLPTPKRWQCDRCGASRDTLIELATPKFSHPIYDHECKMCGAMDSCKEVK